jgi:Xaa-Pro aminopeptidase
MRLPTLFALLSLLGSAGSVPAPGPAFFASHRDRFSAALPPGSIAIVRTAPAPAVEVDALYRPDSDFWYLTGFSEPESIAVLRQGAAENRYVLFVSPRDFTREQWTGWRAGVEGARRDFGADAAYAIDDFWKKLPELWKGAGELVYADGGDEKFAARLLAAWREGDSQAETLRPAADAGPLLHEMRLVKDETEQRLIRRAVELSVNGHRAAMRETRPGTPEYALRAAFEKSCVGGGAARTAYPSIVGSGPNSVILHYERDDRTMQAGDVLVNDSGCEFSMYAADVTRSYPVSGKFTADQRAIYDIVLAAQKAGFAKIHPGAEYHEVYDATVDVVVDGLMRLGIMSGDKAEILESRSFKTVYPHGSSHWLGLNVHDVGSYAYTRPGERYAQYASASRKLEPGMIFTVEPGIYIPPDAPGVDARWKNIGIRIEDDVLVTRDGMECLSCAAPREAADVERAVGGRQIREK